MRVFADGDLEMGERLRERLRPFVLRRLKRDVAPELPPRTEVVLRFDLSDEEREVYRAVEAATVRPVVERLQAGGSVICAVDINTRKQGRFVPGTAQEVVAPEQLVSRGIDVVLVMNPLYVDEIARTLEGLGVSARIEQV